MATVTEGDVDAQTGRLKAELRAETLETLRRRIRSTSGRQCGWLVSFLRLSHPLPGSSSWR